MSKYFYTSLPVLYKEAIEIQNQKLFVSAYQGIASLFVAQAKADFIHKKLDSKSFKVEYLEWSNRTACSEKPLDTVHMIIDGAGEFKPFKIKAKSYIYKIDAAKYSGYLKYEDWMDQEKEATLQGLNSIEFVSVKEHTVELEISCKGKIRKATDKEIQRAITNLRREEDRKYVKSSGKQRVKNMTYDHSLVKYAKEGKYLHSISYDGKGTIIFGRDYVNGKDNETRGHIYSVYVEPKFRHQGVGTKLLEAAFEYLRNRKFTEVNLNVVNENKIAINLYTKAGMKLTKNRKYGKILIQRMDKAL